MATLTAQFFELLEKDQKEIFFRHLTMQEMKFSQLFERKPSSAAHEDALRIGGLGTYATKAEGTPIVFDDPVQGTRVRTVHQTFALGWRASFEMMQDDQHNVMNQMSAELGDSARDHMERLAFAYMNAAFTTSTVLEGEVLFSATHSNIKAGGTQSNLLAPAVQLSVTGLESIMTLAKTTTSDEGRFVDLTQGLLLIHPDESHNAYVLLNTEFRPGTSDNDRSTVVASRSGLVPLEVPYLTNTNGWSVHKKPPGNGLIWYDRHKVEFKDVGDSDTLDKKFYGYYRASATGREWRFSWGSNFALLLSAGASLLASLSSVTNWIV